MVVLCNLLLVVDLAEPIVALLGLTLLVNYVWLIHRRPRHAAHNADGDGFSHL
jgi:uncharacterized membrane protein YjgN (DUF898 family)